MKAYKLMIDGYDNVQWVKEHLSIWRAEDKYRGQRDFFRAKGLDYAKWQEKLDKIQQTEEEHWNDKRRLL